MIKKKPFRSYYKYINGCHIFFCKQYKSSIRLMGIIGCVHGTSTAMIDDITVVIIK